MNVCSYDAQVRHSHGTCVGTLKLLYLCPKVLHKNGCCGVIPIILAFIVFMLLKFSAIPSLGGKTGQTVGGGATGRALPLRARPSPRKARIAACYRVFDLLDPL